MDVRKSDGRYEEFSCEKVKSALINAYNTCNEEYDEMVLDSICKNLYTYDRMTTAEIDRQISEALMSINKKVARAYVDKANSNQVFKKDSDFIKNYILASNAATGSKFDSNAKVE